MNNPLESERAIEQREVRSEETSTRNFGGSRDNSEGGLSLIASAVQEVTPSLLAQTDEERVEEKKHLLELEVPYETLPEQPREQGRKVVKNRRTFEPDLTDKNEKIEWERFTKIFIYTICSASVLTASILISKSFIFNGGSVEKSSYPTSIPWVKSKLECENSGRNWIDDKCWDKEHSEAF